MLPSGTSTVRASVKISGGRGFFFPFLSSCTSPPRPAHITTGSQLYVKRRTKMDGRTRIDGDFPLQICMLRVCHLLACWSIPNPLASANDIPDTCTSAKVSAPAIPAAFQKMIARSLTQHGTSTRPRSTTRVLGPAVVCNDKTATTWVQYLVIMYGYTRSK
jgi:hypothetical protein